MPTKARSIGPLDECAADSICNLRRIAVAVEQVIAADAHLVDQPIEQVAPKACGVIDRQADVLIEMKHFDARPVDGGRRCERFEEIDLRRAGRDDDAGGAFIANACTQGIGRIARPPRDSSSTDPDRF